MKIEIEITKIQVIHDQGPDIVFVTTTMPAPFPSGSLPSPLTMRFETKPGYGVSYVRQMFGIQPEVIYIRILCSLRSKEILNET